MGKRKSGADDKVPSKDKMDVDDHESGSDDGSLLNVDFEYFDPSPTIDFHGLKTLLRQLFDVDNQLFDLSELAEIILAQPLLGSTVKCEGTESDPYAFLTVLNLHEHREKGVIRELTRYLVEKAKGSSQDLGRLLAEGGKHQVGLVLTERFINMPHQVVPPMYNMLLEEIQWANDEKEAYQFPHYLVLSKTYTEVASKLDVEDDRPAKKSKSTKVARGASETFYFHPEDEILEKHATATIAFDYSKQAEDGASDAKRAFQEMGVRPQGRMMLIEAGKFEGAVKAVGEYLGSEA
ncbi:Mss4p nuclear export [Extremus antarcticus]|uniref:Protein BCP1 n=1 Tax=Extremus antarcticus TaxID=702011 RepID=A0AAJ0DGQ4_9PEZI|nr:Mss4p nuclear export [Extremus antarcticus]